MNGVNEESRLLVVNKTKIYLKLESVCLILVTDISVRTDQLPLLVHLNLVSNLGMRVSPRIILLVDIR